MSTFLDPRTKINASKKKEKKIEIHNVCKMGDRIYLQKTKAIKITQKQQKKKRNLITCWVQGLI